MEVPFASSRARSPIVAASNPFCAKDKSVLENSRLSNSKKWINRRCSRYAFFNERDRKSKLDSVISKCETMRVQPVEMRKFLERAKFLVHPDKWQGDQISSEIPPASLDRGNSFSPEVRPAHTKNELDSLPTFECGKMDSKTGKDDSSNLSGNATDWVKSSYLKTKSLKMADDVKTLQSKDLVIRGRSLINERNENVVIKTPIISVMDTSVEDQSSEVGSEESLVNPDRVVTLKVDWLEITKNDSSIFESTDHDLDEVTWTMNFHSNKMNERSEKCIHFENKGTAAILYRWRNVTPRTSTPLPKTNAGFYFNKNEALILPGQKVEFVVSFYKREAGISSELWCMKTEPVTSRKSFFLRMRGSVDPEDSFTSQSRVDSYLDYCIRNTTVQQTVDNIIRSVRHSRAAEPMYKDLYLQEELFSAENASYFYHSDLMNKFHRLYETATASGSPPEKLSLFNLRKILLKIEDVSLRQRALEEFGDLCQQSLRPRLRLSTSFNSKHAMIYNVLCVFFDKMEEESELVKKNCILRGDDGSEITKNDVGIDVSSTRSNAQRISANSIPRKLESSKTNESADVAVYQEVFYIRTYKLLEDAIYHACVIIDSLNNLEGLE